MSSPKMPKPDERGFAATTKPVEETFSTPEKRANYVINVPKEPLKSKSFARRSLSVPPYNNGRSESACTCSICMSEPPRMAMVPCGHVFSCEGCTAAMLELMPTLVCPICRGNVEGAIKIYIC